jgi:hypothetical protein
MRRFLFSIVVLFAFSVTLAMNFKPPTAAERRKAIGPTEGLPETLRKALEPGAGFEPIPAPKRGDWRLVPASNLFLPQSVETGWLSITKAVRVLVIS